MIVRIALKETSQEIVLEARNTYTKGPFFCVYMEGNVVQKFPHADIWRVTETYSADRAHTLDQRS